MSLLDSESGLGLEAVVANLIPLKMESFKKDCLSVCISKETSMA